MKIKILFFTAVLFLQFLLMACAKKPKIEARQEPTPPPMQTAQPEAKPTIADTGARIQDLLNEAFKPVYFPYDRAELPAEAKDLLARAGDLLKKAPTVKVLVEGNADERGTEAYNLALGEKRAAVVKSYLVQYGIDASRLNVISYGEEKPSQPGHEESDWAKNRRDEFKVSFGPEE
ncbi:MAG: OmpA family protein [Fibrobacteria bacterium]